MSCGQRKHRNVVGGSPQPNSVGVVGFTDTLVDNGPFGDTFNAQPGPVPTACAAPDPGLPLLFGAITVVDASTSADGTDECKNGGWRAFGVFKNQGDCVSFVATGGKNPPASSP